MTAPADRILANAEVHTLARPDETHEAVAIRDGRVVRVGRDDEVRFLEDVETEVLDLDGRVVLPGFVDAHTHLEMLGRYVVHADLSEATSPAECVERLREAAGDDREWILGLGYDESGWTESRYLTRADLDRVSEERPVAAFREDGHAASLNGVALDRLADDLPAGDVRRAGGEPTGVVVERAVGAVRDATAPDPAETRELLLAAQERAVALGVTGVHDMVRDSHAPRVYRELDRAGELSLRVRVNYWATHLDALVELGERTSHGSDRVRVGAVKTFTDGSFGARTAKLDDPYEPEASDPDGTESAPGGMENSHGGTEDTPDGGPGADSGEDTGQWVVEPDRLRELVERADRAGFQVAVHAIGDAAVRASLDALEGRDDASRHRIEHAELMDDALLDRFADAGVVASVHRTS